MKTIKHLVLILLVIGFTSCEKSYFEGVNESDNLPTDVPIYALVPSCESHLAFGQYGDASRYTSVFMQYVTGASRQFAAYDIYSFTENDFDNLWRLNIYAGPLNDIYTIIEKSKTGGNKYYQGVGEILMAYGLGYTTDLWGDIPYSDAFQGANNLQPTFNTQSDIYGKIQLLLDDAITLLNGTDDSPFQPGSEDLIYGGDLNSWINLAHGLKARFYIHLSKVNTAASDSVLAVLSRGGLASSGEDALMRWGETDPTSNPWYQYIRDRDDIVYDGYCIQTMQTKNDPRYGSYIDVNGDFWGPGYLGVPFTLPNAPTPYFTYYEQKFIEAEAKLRTGDDAGSLIALTDAITTNMSDLGVSSTDITTYITANVLWTGTTSDKLGELMYEKYVAMYLQPEAWTDWRRTDLPALTPNPSGVINQIPRRFIYPVSERLYNSNCPQSTNLVSPRCWWDN